MPSRGGKQLLRAALPLRWVQQPSRMHIGVCLAIAWAVCLVPRIAAVHALAISAEYEHFLRPILHTYWYPLYRVIAPALWSITGGHLQAHVYLNVALHALVGPAVYLLARLMRFPSGSAWLSVLGVAWLPYYVSTSARQPQLAFTLVVFALWMLVFIVWARSGFAVRLGLLFAGTSFLFYTLRPNGLSSVVVLYLFSAWVGVRVASMGPRTGPSRGRYGMICSAALFSALMFGMCCLNVVRTGWFTPFTSNLGYNLYLGNNPHVQEYVWRLDIDSMEAILLEHPLPPAVANEPDPVRRDRLQAQLGLQYIASHRLLTIKNAVCKAIRYWDFRPNSPPEGRKPLAWQIAFGVPYLSYVALGVWGWIIMWRRKMVLESLVIVLVLVSYFLPHMVLIGNVRMRMITDLLLIMLAAYAVGVLLESRWKKSRSLDSPVLRENPVTSQPCGSAADP